MNVEYVKTKVLSTVISGNIVTVFIIAVLLEIETVKPKNTDATVDDVSKCLSEQGDCVATESSLLRGHPDLIHMKKLEDGKVSFLGILLFV